MKLSRLLALGVALLLTGVAVAEYGPQTPAAAANTPVRWKKLDDAMEESARTRKPVFTMVHAPWCGYCRKMDATTFRDPEIVKILGSKFVPSRLDGESENTVRWPPKKAVSEAEIAQGLGIRGFPTLVFFRHDRKELMRISSYLPAADMKKVLDAVLAYDASGALDKGIDFDRWYDASQR